MGSELLDYESRLVFEIAMGREKKRPGLERRVAVEEVWRSMADGTADCHERQEWLSYIAERIISRVIDNPAVSSEGRKGRAALDAIWLNGRRIDDSELIRDLDSLVAFENLDKPGKAMSHLDKVRSLRKLGHFKEITERQAVRKIQNLIQNRKAGLT